MQHTPSIRTFLIVAVSALCVCSDKAWSQTVTLCDENGWQVRLHVTQKPSLANRGWLSLEIENTSGRQEIVDNLHYRIDKTVSSWSGGLCSGSMYQVFGREKIPHRISRGSKRVVVEPLTTMAGASLVETAKLAGTGAQEAVQVKGNAYFSLNVSHGGNSSGERIETPQEGIPFSFLWTAVRPNDEELLLHDVSRWCDDASADQNRWKRDGRRYNHQNSIYSSVARQESLIAAILELPDLHEFWPDDLLQRISDLERHMGVTFAAKKILFDRDPDYKPYLEAYAERISGWRQVYEMHRTGFWHPDLFDSLIDRARSPHDDGNTSSFRVSSMALRVLEKNRDRWDDNPQQVAQFNAAKRTFLVKYLLNAYGKLTFFCVAAVSICVVVWFRRRPSIRPPPQTSDQH